MENIRKNINNIECQLNGKKSEEKIERNEKEKAKEKNLIINAEKLKDEQSEFLQKYKAVTSNKNIENNCNKAYDNVSNHNNNNDNDNDVNENNDYEDCKIEEKKNDTPPKPLPRKSISEQSSLEEGIPIPKPRTSGSSSSNNYKVSIL